eukprot:TRINITY_DN2709_c0_g1_i1.p2 TRINITY_DN2709_c0_g1~~TRINITY_DN2709_c0_g1_i1.p2  ORF type:complete len:122 (+),score=45.20 TRINITY_DN2709_c0_g1_i1:294-659(+)
MYYVNEYGKQVGSVIDLSQFDGVGLERELAQKGITAATKKPEYIEQQFAHTQHCKAWRATADCSAQGKREPPNDVSCHDSIPADKSGYCQCASGTRLNFDCEEGRPPFTCNEMCQEPLDEM